MDRYIEIPTENNNNKNGNKMIKNLILIFESFENIFSTFFLFSAAEREIVARVLETTI